MNKKIKIEFAEQSKCVVAKTYVETELESGDEAETKELMLEAKQVFKEAQEYSKLKTMEKLK